MNNAVPEILIIAAPLLFATLGALSTEYAGVLAVFMDGAINLSAFLCIAVTAATGSPLAGFAAATVGTVLFVLIAAIFTEITGANPFLSGLSLNLFAMGITSLFSVVLFGTRGVVPLSDSFFLAFIRPSSFFIAAFSAILFYIGLKTTRVGLNLRITGSSAQVLIAKGIQPAKYRIFSWGIAAFFAACAGSTLSLSLGAWVPNISAGRGWTALAAVYLGYRNPLGCIAAVLVFAGAGYMANILQGTGLIPASLLLGLPHALALLVFIFSPVKKE